jgi:glutathione S-transferase
MDGKGAPDPANPHPDKKVPALLDNGVLIMESIAIVQYLTDKFPAAKLGPSIGDAHRGPYLSWLAYYAGVIEPVINLEFAGLADNAVMQRTFRDRSAMDRRILAALEAGPYVLGDTFSGADILIASVVRRTIAGRAPSSFLSQRCNLPRACPCASEGRWLEPPGALPYRHDGPSAEGFGPQAGAVFHS